MMRFGLRQVAALLCAECDEYRNAERQADALVLVRLSGLKARWWLCRCGERAGAYVGGQRVYYEILGGYFPEADPLPRVVVCPPGSAAGALTQDEWRRR